MVKKTEAFNGCFIFVWKHCLRKVQMLLILNFFNIFGPLSIFFEIDHEKIIRCVFRLRFFLKNEQNESISFSFTFNDLTNRAISKKKNWIKFQKRIQNEYDHIDKQIDTLLK